MLTAPFASPDESITGSNNGVIIIAIDTAKVNAQGNNLPTMKVYTSTMCLDCQKMKGVVKEIEPEYKNKINIISINALDNRKSVQDEIKKYGIVLVPTIIYINSKAHRLCRWILQA